MLSVTLLASGSSGNCAVVKTDDAQVLVDAGTPYKTLAARMAYLGLEPADTAAILVTHEHTDHVSGLRVAARRLDIPVYLSKGTDRKTAFTGDSHVVGADDPFTVRDLHVQPLAASHDAEEPLAFAFRSGDSRAAILTDTGIATPAMHKVVRKAQFLALEANHDEQVLMAGRYPAYLKQRILSDEGHLSNAQAGCLLMESASDALSGVTLAHLSEQNNTVQLARETISHMISHRNDVSLELDVGQRHAVSRTAVIEDGCFSWQGALRTLPFLINRA